MIVITNSFQKSFQQLILRIILKVISRIILRIIQQSQASKRSTPSQSSPMASNLFILTVIFCVFNSVSARYLAGSINTALFRKDKGWIFLDRMIFDEANISLKIALNINSPRQSSKTSFNLILQIIPDFAWQKQIEFKCDYRPQTTSLRTIISQGNIVTPSITKILEVPLIFTRQKGFSLQEQFSFPINQSIAYNFVLKDCNKELINEPWRRQTKLQYILELKNGKSVHGSDEKINSVLFPFLIISTVLMIYDIRKHTKQSFQGQIDMGKILVLSSLILNLAGLMFYWIGYIVYTMFSEKFYGFFDFMYLLFHSVSESVLTALILFVAFGWTITYIDDASYDLYVPLSSMLGVMHLLLTLLGKLNDGSPNKYHMYDSVPSYILVFIRLLSCCIMLFGVMQQYNGSRKNKKQSDFYFRFGILCFIYFISLPAIMIIARTFEAEDRKAFVLISVEIFQNGVNALMTWMVTSKNSRYSGAKLTNSSFMQSQNKLL